MNNTPLISVLIPAYNHAKYIGFTLQALLDQTYPNIELLVHDDGSQDETWNVLQAWLPRCQKRFTRVEFSTAPNQGTCKTLNLLTSKATGKYLYLTASDDVPDTKALTQLASFLEANPSYVLAVGNNRFMDADNRPCAWDRQLNIVYTAQETVYPTQVDFLQAQKKFKFTSRKFGSYATLYTGNYIPNGYLFRRDIFNKFAPFTPQAPLEDYWLMLQLAKYGPMKYLDEVLFYYRQHASNTIKNQQKMDALVLQTHRYEQGLLKKLAQGGKLPRAAKPCYPDGLCRYNRGIPFLFQIQKYVQIDREIKKIKLFGYTIFRKEIIKS